MIGRPHNGLLQASFRGIPFYIQYDIDHEAGRRMQTTIFPGIDPDADDDFGKHNGEISVRGFLIGDTYISQEKRLRKAFETAGPGTLVHPWLGEMLVILIQPAQFSFSEKELRVCRFEFTCKRSFDGLSLLPSSLSGLISAILNVVSSAQNLFSAVLSIRELPLGAWAAGRDYAHNSVVILQSHATGSKGSAIFESALEKPLKTFETALANETTTEGIKDLSQSYSAIPGILAESALTPPKAAIGLGPSGTTPVSPGEEVGAQVLKQTILTVTESVSAVETEQSAQSTFEISCLAAIAGLTTEMNYETRQQAKAALDDLIILIDKARSRLIILSATYPAAAAEALTALEQLRAAVSIDMNEIIGRLPVLDDVTIKAPVSSFILANHFYGDDVTRIVTGQQDLVNRNRPKYPGSMADMIEVLSDV